MIEAKQIYDKVITLQSLDLVMHEDINNIDALIEQLQSLKPSITLEQSVEALSS